MLIGLAAVAATGVLLSAGCVASLAVAGAALFTGEAPSICSLAARPATSGIEPPGGRLPAADEPLSGTVGQTPCPSALGDDLPANPVTAPAPDAQAGTAVAAALTAVGLGGRYVAEGNGPVDFDCSGLTAWAWRQAGVSLVDYSYTQRSQTRDIPRGLVQPGDLAFWFGGAEHHVALVTAVAGASITIAEAANPAAGIRVRQLGGEWDDAFLTGFGRVVRG